jgi:dipeptidyl aminopeptidase/acylaminoacyl peptidase
VLGFNGGYGSQVYAGAGYVVLRPNYRGSTNYGQRHRTDIVGNYFPPGYDDIMAGVDHLIAEGIVDPDRMGALGWSAGGHWSNWILTSDRPLQGDQLRRRHLELDLDVRAERRAAEPAVLPGRQAALRRLRRLLDQSPLKYIKNAKTPTMIHVVEGDPRVPSPQSVELHMALKQLGVPTELFMYPARATASPIRATSW